MGKTQKEAKSHAVNAYVVTEHSLTREPLIRSLQKCSGINVVAASQSAACTPEQIVAVGCDVLLFDSPTTLLAMDLIEDIVARAPHIKILAFGMNEDLATFLHFVHSGVSGYVLKNASAPEKIAAVYAVAQGESAFPAKLCVAFFEVVARGLRPKVGMALRQGRIKFGLALLQREFEDVLAGNLVSKGVSATDLAIGNSARQVARRQREGNPHETINIVRVSGLPSSL